MARLLLLTNALQPSAEVLPALENEDAVGPKENPFKILYREQFGGR